MLTMQASTFPQYSADIACLISKLFFFCLYYTQPDMYRNFELKKRQEKKHKKYIYMYY